MDAMRELSAQPAEAAPVVHQLTDTSDVVPLFGYANAAGSTLRLNEDQRVGVVPIHPAQRGSRSAFAFLVFGDSLSPRLNHGETGYAVRNKTPVKGQPVLIELVSGEVLVKVFERVDEQTVFLSQLSPKKELSVKLQDVRAMHAVVGATYL
jgi:phage repressor protein C with HTH and peptisase S24 domain